MPFLPDLPEVEAAVGKAVRAAVGETLRALAGDVERVRLLARPGLTAAEVGALLGCSAKQVQVHHVKRGLRCYAPGRAAVFLPDDVQAYIRRYPIGPAADSPGDDGC